MRVSPWWCFGASMMSLVTNPRFNSGKRLSFLSNVWYIWLQSFVRSICGILSSWNISASSWYMCPQLACCLLNTDLGPTVIHTFQPPVSFLLYSRLLFCFSALANIFILLLLSTSIYILILVFPCLCLVSSQGPLATLQHQESDIEMSCPFMSARDTEKGENEKKTLKRLRVR